MKLTIVEGTPAELLEAFPSIFPGKAIALEAGLVAGKEASTGIGSAMEQTAVSSEAKMATKKLARDMLTRRPLSIEQIAVLKKLYDAHPNQVAATELQKLTKYSTAQFAGLMGAFGRRLAKTPGFEPYTRFFDQEWDQAAGCNRYGLPDAVHEAVGEEPWAK